MTERTTTSPSAGDEVGGRSASALLLVVGVLTAVGVLVAALYTRESFDPGAVLSVYPARGPLFVGAIAAAVIAAWSVLAPHRLRPLAAALPLLGLGLVLAIAAVAARHYGDMLCAALVLTACWEVGERTLRRLGAVRLAELAPVAWLAGTGVLGAVLLLAGRADALRWWIAGVPVLLIGAFGMGRLVLRVRPRIPALRAAVLRSPLGIAAVGLSALPMALLAVYASAPDVGFDALYYKAWLPALWSATGEIGAQPQHPQVSLAGTAQLLAIPGHLLDAPEVGRWLQYWIIPGIAATVGWAWRRSTLAPLAALAATTAPLLAWQAQTAFEDALIAAAAIAVAIAVVADVSSPAARAAGPLSAGTGLGLLAGSLLAFKLHTAVLAAALALAWLVLTSSAHGRGWRRLAGLATGGIAAAALPFAFRATDYGNPVYPAYNNFFRSSTWPAVNEHYNLPYWADAPWHGIVTWPWRILERLNPLGEAAPAGGLGMMLGVLLVSAVLVPVLARRSRLAQALGLTLAVTLLVWYVQFRYERYLLPVAGVALITLPLALGASQVGRRLQMVGLALGTVATMLVLFQLPMMIFQVPEGRVPFGSWIGTWDPENFRARAFPELGVLRAFDRLAPPGSTAAGVPHERTYLDAEHDVTPPWEIMTRLTLLGGPADPETTRRRLARLGVDWLIRSQRGFENPTLEAVATAKGELVFADHNWELLHLVSRPPSKTIRRRLGAAGDGVDLRRAP